MHRSKRGLRKLPLVVTALAAGVACVGAATASAGSILVYTGNGAVFDNYVQFGLAAGKPVVTSPTVPADLSPFDCLVLSTNTIAFSADQKAQFGAYVNAGGRLLAIGEYGTFRPGLTATMNDLAASLGSGMRLTSELIGAGYFDTTNIDPHPFTAGVTTIR